MKFNIFKDVVQIPNDKGVNENYNVLVVHDENNQVLAHSQATKESVVFLEYDGLFTCVMIIIRFGLVGTV